MVAEADCNGALCDRPLATLYTQFSQSYKNAPFRDRLLGSAVCWPPNVRNGWHQPFLRFCVFRCPYRGIRPVDMSTHVQQQPQTLRIATPLGTCPSQSLTRSEQLPTIRRLEEPQATSLPLFVFFFSMSYKNAASCSRSLDDSASKKKERGVHEEREVFLMEDATGYHGEQRPRT